MNLYEAMEKRRSIRAYKPDPVPQDALERILRAAQVAPSWKNRQAWHILTIEKRDTLVELDRLLEGNPRGVDYGTLPMVLVLVMDPAAVDVYDGKEYYLVDAGIVGEHLVLAAEAEGLATCWLGWFTDAPIKELLGVPASYRIAMITPLGYPAEAPAARPRKALSAFVHKEKW